MYRPTDQQQPVVTVDGAQLYHLDNGSLDRKINSRILCAITTFGRLKERVYLNRNQKLSTKIKVCKVIAIPTLIHGAESWSPHSTQLKSLNKFHLQCLRITWKD